MALIVEDGSGLPDAQAYASVAQLRAYASARRITLPTDAECEAMLVLGADAMRGLDYKGSRATKSQALDFPRIGVCIDGFEYASSELPPQLIDANCALAIESRNQDLLPTISAESRGPVVQETVGPVSRAYASGGIAPGRPLVHKAQVYLRKLLRNSGGLRIVRA
jgi:hypothetical protein